LPYHMGLVWMMCPVLLLVGLVVLVLVVLLVHLPVRVRERTPHLRDERLDPTPYTVNPTPNPLTPDP
jgi:uncharacterized membrane protein